MSQKCQLCSRWFEGEKCPCNAKEEPWKVEDPIRIPGRFFWMKGCKYPVKGYPVIEVADLNATFKRAILATMKLVSKPPIRYTLPALVFLPPFLKRKLVEAVIAWVSEISYVAFFKNYLPANRFSRSGRELLRVGQLMTLGKGLIYKHFVLGLVMSWDWDNAYRLRGQDVFGLIDKEALRKNPRKELVRIFKIGLERERALVDPNHKKINKELIDLSDKWKMIILGLNLGLWIFPDVLKVLKEFFLELNLDEIKLDEGDIYWCSHRKDYDFLGLPYEERRKFRDQVDKEYVQPIEPKEFRAEIKVSPNEDFFKLPKEKAQNLMDDISKKIMAIFASKQ